MKRRSFNQAGASPYRLVVTLAVYLVAGWILLQVVEQLVAAFALPAWLRPFALVILILGVPFVAVWVWRSVPDGQGREDD